MKRKDRVGKNSALLSHARTKIKAGKAVVLTLTLCVAVLTPLFVEKAQAISTWITETVDSEVGGSCSVAVDSSGNPHISYLNTTTYGSARLKYARWTGTEWFTETVDSTTNIISCSIAVDSNDNPHVSFYDAVNDELRYVRWTGTEWNFETVVSFGVGLDKAARPSLALDSNNNPHISYRSPNNDHLYYVNKTNSVWGDPSFIPVGGWVTEASSLALDSGDNPYICVGDWYYGEIEYWYWTGTGIWGWDYLIVDLSDMEYPGTVVDAHSFSLALDSNDYPHVSYHVYHTISPVTPSYGGVRYARWDGTDWNYEDLDDYEYGNSDRGVGNSLALDSFDNPCISYCGAGSDYALRFANWTGTDWSFETVDYVVDLYDSSLALDSYGNPHIFYCNVTNSDLKHAFVNQHPVANANGPYTGAEGYGVNFDGSGSYDPDGTTVSYNWDFGDGNTGTGVSPSHAYAQEDTYAVTLTVTDNRGGTAMDTTTASISDRDPSPGFSAYPRQGHAPLTVAFTDQSYSYDGLVSWLWDFGDGHTSTQQNPIHEYTEEGVYTVTVTVYEADGDSATATMSHYIFVKAAIYVVFDESHWPTYSTTDYNLANNMEGYAEFANYLASAGYVVSTIDFGTTIDATILAPVEILVIAAPQMSYSTAEIDAIETWVRDGGELLLITEESFGGWDASLIAGRFGLTQPLDLILDLDENLGDPYASWVYYEGANLLPHLVTSGVTRVELYASDGVTSAPADEIPLLVTDSDGSAYWYPSGVPALGVSLMSAIDRGGVAGAGRLIFLTDSDLWGAHEGAYDFDGDGDENFYDSDNEVLALNAINWLASGIYDIQVTAVTPDKTVVGQGYSLSTGVIVENHGEWPETFNVTLFYSNAAITPQTRETFWGWGDVNRDGYIDDLDGDLLSAAFSSTPGDVNWNPDADLNQDGVVSVYDMSTYGLNYGKDLWTEFGLVGGHIGRQLVTDLLPDDSTTVVFVWDTTGILYDEYFVSARATRVPGETNITNNALDDGWVTVTIPGDIDGDYLVGSADAGILNGAYGSWSEDPLYVPEADLDGDGYIGSADAGILNGAYGTSYP